MSLVCMAAEATSPPVADFFFPLDFFASSLVNPRTLMFFFFLINYFDASYDIMLFVFAILMWEITDEINNFGA